MTEQLTREQVLNMKPGPEMRTTVAKEIMGWTNVVLKDEVGYVCMGTPPHMKDWPEPEHISIPHWGTDISAAFELFTRPGWQGRLAYSGSDWFCSIMIGFDEKGIGVYTEAEGDTAPESICKAMLLAVLEV